jgi:predicted XRE-type DNA-binding protein
MSQTAAAKIMNVSRPRLNQMLRGKVEGVTFDRILQMADARRRKSESELQTTSSQGRLILAGFMAP